jgi:hypothetical protein
LYSLLYRHRGVGIAAVVDHLLPTRLKPLSGQAGGFVDPMIRRLALVP